MLDILYNLFISPIQMIVEMTYILMSRFVGNKGLAIIAVSLVVQTLVLPLYKRADALQDEEREKQQKMAHWVEHIKKTFKGDERFMMLSTYYRQQDYKTVYALKSSFSILLQIPFFMAAYNYLSHLQELKGVSFLFINDLGRPDALFSIGGFTVNILPIMMTLINIISGIIYTKGMPFKSKLQVYGLAAVFLVLLYKSPAGLVLYWTMNNIYSLLKNIFMKVLKHPDKVLGVASAVLGVLLYVYVFRQGVMTKIKLAFIICVVAFCQLPWINNLYKKKRDKDRFGEALSKLNTEKNFFGWIMILLTVFMGAYIPLLVISASATEFVLAGANPMRLVYNNLSIYAGVFLVWFSIFYFLMTDKVRKLFSVIVFGCSGVLLFDFMRYSGKQGLMNAALVYDELPIVSAKSKLLNLIAIVIIFAVLFVLACKKMKFSKMLAQVLVICVTAISIKNVVSVNKQYDDYCASRTNMAHEEIFSLSKEGQNVVVIMLDRAISGYLPYIYQEFPDLKAQFDGFTYYPNTLCFGAYTNFATPAFFGGYEYTPTEMNARSDELLVEKHNEAMSVLPVLFSENNYDVTVCDPPHVNYKWQSDVSLYDQYEGVNAYVTNGAFTEKMKKLDIGNYLGTQKKNFQYFSIYRTVPLAIQNQIYNGGLYLNSPNEGKVEMTNTFSEWYTALDSLREMTIIADDDSNNFLMLQNMLTHEAIVLDAETYEPKKGLDPYIQLWKQPERTINGHTLKIYNDMSLAHYQANVVALQLIGTWLDYLRENDVYDNTRIIIASDHGKDMGQFDYMQLENGVDVEFYNPLLMVKDFGSTGFTVCDDFMTNADIPYLTVDNVIDNPVNPFTGKVINNDEKYAHPQRITTSQKYSIVKNNGNTFDTSDGVWYDVKDNIFDVNNWKQVVE